MKSKDTKFDSASNMKTNTFEERVAEERHPDVPRAMRLYAYQIRCSLNGEIDNWYEFYPLRPLEGFARKVQLTDE